METPCDIILTSSNYFSQKSRMEEGTFQDNLREETEPTNDDKKIKWANRCDEARGLIGMSISTDL